MERVRFDLAPRLLGYEFYARAEAADQGLGRGDIGDIAAGVEKLEVLADRCERTGVAGVEQGIKGQKAKRARPGIGIRIAPVADGYRFAGPWAFRRQGGPADKAGVAYSPGDPGRRPVGPWCPNPAGAVNIRPPTIVIGGPTERFVCVPIPAAVGRFPMSVGIGPPIGIFFGEVRLKNVAVILDENPMSV